MDIKYCEHANNGRPCQNLRNSKAQPQFYRTCALNLVSVYLVTPDNCFPNISSIPKFKTK